MINEKFFIIFIQRLPQKFNSKSKSKSKSKNKNKRIRTRTREQEQESKSIVSKIITKNFIFIYVFFQLFNKFHVY